MKNNRVAHRVVFLAAAGLSLMLGLVAAAARLGIDWGPLGAATSLAKDHGPLMIFGFIGGAIGLERTVAVKTSWAWCGPILHVLGVITLLAGLPRVFPALFFGGSFLVLGAIYANIYQKQPQPAVVVQAVGVIGGVGAVWLWLITGEFDFAMPLAVLYGVATVLGERMELARITIAGANQEKILASAVLALGATAIIFVAVPGLGYRLMGLVLVINAVLFLRADAAKNLIRSTGLPRYSAACMLAGYAWLAIAGVIWLGFGKDGLYDAAVHAIFLGFIMSMIFAHAPTILAGVVRAKMPFHPLLYAPVALLHLGLLVRVFAHSGQLGGGIINIGAVLLFVFSAVGLVIHARS